MTFSNISCLFVVGVVVVVIVFVILFANLIYETNKRLMILNACSSPSERTHTSICIVYAHTRT